MRFMAASSGRPHEHRPTGKPAAISLVNRKLAVCVLGDTSAAGFANHCRERTGSAPPHAPRSRPRIWCTGRTPAGTHAHVSRIVSRPVSIRPDRAELCAFSLTSAFTESDA